jgi:hypothetical protein
MVKEGTIVLEFSMQRFSRLATTGAAIAFISLSATIALAQTGPTTETKTTAAPAAATTAQVEPKPASSTEQKKRGPARHRKSAHKDYLHFVPFDKMW